ncbi:MAG TPA: AmmeMemoRadiSam system protein A [Burkholderiales bacterium]|nr:AmmeMemoRadiSam system protein A [Burkholderiales bacterium]
MCTEPVTASSENDGNELLPENAGNVLLPENAGSILLPLARAAIARQLNLSAAVDDSAPWLRAIGASFVTLKKDVELRGCIGTLEAQRPLGLDVAANAIAAAFRDPRFAPLRHDEFDAVRIEVSVLSPSAPLAFRDEADALAQLRSGRDGVIFESDGRRSTFLPQVWEQLPEPRLFLAQLKIKAGLPHDFWSPRVRLARYTVSKWHETR